MCQPCRFTHSNYETVPYIHKQRTAWNGKFLFGKVWNRREVNVELQMIRILVPFYICGLLGICTCLKFILRSSFISKMSFYFPYEYLHDVFKQLLHIQGKPRTYSAWMYWFNNKNIVTRLKGAIHILEYQASLIKVRLTAFSL